MSALSALIDALFATRCILCKRLGATCCQGCWGLLEFRQRVVVRGANLKGVSTIDFDPTVGTLVHAFKDSGHSVLAGRFASAMVAPLLTLCAELWLDRCGRIYLVPVPSRLSSIQTRGFSPAALVATALVGILEPRFGSSLADSGPNFALKTGWVWRSLETSDQAALSQQHRKENLVEAMSASARASAKRIILVDDIVTTGSSLIETARALESVGAEIVGFVTFAEAILRKI
jgi:predicted amidophosphoribosyltransferase